MAGTAVRGRLSWYAATVIERRKETLTASTLALNVPGWPGHVAGQHVDVRLRAADGYAAARTYSIASAPNGERIEITVELMPDGEVSPYLVEKIAPGDPVEILGPIGGWFVWRPQQTEPIQLIAGGSGIVPLMATIRSRNQSGSRVPFRLIYSVRTPEALIYGGELHELANEDDGILVSYAYTRVAPPGWPAAPGRVDGRLVSEKAIPAAENPTCYICGPTGMVEAVSALLIQAGYNADRVKTERFGPTG